MNLKKLPVTVLSGFLGAGKTEISHRVIVGLLKIQWQIWVKNCKFVSNNRGALKAEIIPIEPGTGNAV